MARKASVHNLGCKVNAYETRAMEQLLKEAGYEIVPFEPGADVYVINTCTVTNIADRKSRQMLHKAKKMNPDAIVVAAGCYAQTDTEHLSADPSVDIILGNNRKKNLLEAIKEFEKEKRAHADVLPILRTKEYEEIGAGQATDRTRAFVKVQDGCSQFCTYCIIPYARGRVRSRLPEDVINEIQTLRAEGYTEVVLTGIHLSSYGIDFTDKDSSLIDLIRRTAEVPGITRVRLGSLEPGIITEEFAKALAEIPEICPHFHLSLQSGCDRTLERMNRKYRTAEYMEKCSLLRTYFDAPALTTDIITGFPGETQEDFMESYRFVEKVHFFETHIFPYSRRKGTKADRMDGQLPEQVKKERSAEFIKLNRIRMEEYATSFIGKELEILVEEELTAGDERYYTGHSREYLTVAVPYDEGLCSGDVVRVKAVRGAWEDLHCNLAGFII